MWYNVHMKRNTTRAQRKAERKRQRSKRYRHNEQGFNWQRRSK